MNEKESANNLREELIQNLYTWGPALTQEIRAAYPNSVVLELVQSKVVTRKRFSGFEVYLLSGIGLRSYGYAMRYNYIPAKSVVLGSLIVRAMARHYEQEGYKITMYDGYAKRGRDNLLLARKYRKLTIVIGRAAPTLRSLRLIVGSLQETFPKIAGIHTVVIQGKHDPLMLDITSLNDIPFKLVQLPLLKVTREEFPKAVTDN